MSHRQPPRWLDRRLFDTPSVIGTASGTILARNVLTVFFETVRIGQNFSLPWTQIGLIVLPTTSFRC